MSRIRRILFLTTLLAGLIAAPTGAQVPQPQVHLPGPILNLKPDLVVSLSTDARGAAGAEVPVTITVTNKGLVKALGTSEAPANKGYVVDLVWSADSVIPMTAAVQPVYQGLTREDFVEDMLVVGGRISNTKSIPPGGSVTYSLPAYAPKNMKPGTYWLGAYVDSLGHVAESKETNNTTGAKVEIGTNTTVTTAVPAGTDYWVMPWKVGNTALFSIKPSGLVDYTDGLSLRQMTDAPFGGHLGFRHGYDSRLPTAGLFYYRWLYQPVGGSGWQEFSETIGAHYVHKVGTTVSFPVYALGPKSVLGMNLYEFRPHQPPAAEAGAENTWPATDWFGDIYSGLLNSTALPEGSYRFKLEVYDQSGILVTQGPTTFRFLAPSGTTADGTVTTVPAPAASLDGTGYVFTLHVDNRRTNAVIDPPSLGGGTATDACGFLPYDPAVNPAVAAARIRLAFHATHPANFAVFSYDVIRATTSVVAIAGEVAAATVGAFNGDGSGNFSASLTRTEMLGPCLSPAAGRRGAFAEVLHVLPKATTGWHQRISAYDAYTVRAFALAPK